MYRHLRTFVPPAFAYTGKLRPHFVTPRRTVPDHIPKPDYWKTGIPQSERTSKARHTSPIYTAEEIAGIREACRIGREVLDVGASMIKPGVTSEAIDIAVHEATITRGAYPSPLNYRDFPKSCCISVNEVICHGIPDLRPLQDGDIVNIDITCYYKGTLYPYIRSFRLFYYMW
jgi:methionyl aminopeptidase